VGEVAVEMVGAALVGYLYCRNGGIVTSRMFFITTYGDWKLNQHGLSHWVAIDSPLTDASHILVLVTASQSVLANLSKLPLWKALPNPGGAALGPLSAQLTKFGATAVSNMTTVASAAGAIHPLMQTLGF